ncbi:hypothetical protein BD289DRAFT_178585 [Coniella lustricola]|uniref:Uncharacterized protein n=1 Tax=Coniella lustricola TaxID=2025994 RepID=A0A2T3ADK1_9PEZI|nr:hypothetical protein BD289DRAFT_178585 [Coniella lustricola]
MGNQISSLSNKTVVGWAIIFALVAYNAQRYIQEKKRKTSKQASQRTRGQEKQVSQPKKDNKAKRQRLESFATEAKQTQPKSYASAAAPAKSNARDSDADVDNRAFAQQMARNKESKFEQKQGPAKQKQKSVKQSKARAIGDDNEAAKESAASSTAGIDADDDQSSAASPALGAADATGVSDMLEPQQAGPSVLRLTGTEEKQTKAPKQVKASEPVETKKQRQNRKKREQEKAAREEEEKDRKVLENKQRRAAREAEGRAAKDGVAFEAAQRANAWASNTSNGTSAQKDAPVFVQPLDTFDGPSKPQTAASVAPVNGKQKGNKTDWAAEVPYSEEEQMAMLQKQDEEDNHHCCSPNHYLLGSQGQACHHQWTTQLAHSILLRSFERRWRRS